MSSSKKDQWTASNHPNFLDYIERFTIGQYFEVPFRKHKSETYYAFTGLLIKDTCEINHFIQKFMPYGTYNNRTYENESFKPWTSPESLNKMLHGSGRDAVSDPTQKTGGGRAKAVTWRTYESKDDVASLRIEPVTSNGSDSASDSIKTNNYFKVALTVYITDTIIYQAIARLLGFFDSDKYHHHLRLSKYVLSVNDSLNKHLGLSDLGSIVFDFLLVQ